MSTPLHDIDVLRSLAEGPEGAGRDWANLGLAVRAPELVRDLPNDAYDAALVMTAGAPACRERVRQGLRGAETTELTAVLAEQLSSFGLSPVGDDGMASALREAIRGDGAVRDLYLAQLLADMGFLDGPSLAAASQVTHDDAAIGLPALVVRFATLQGAGREAAEAVVREVAGKPGADQPHFAANLLALGGVPHLKVGEGSDRELAERVSALMGRDAPSVRAKGAPRRRAQKWVRELCDHLEHPGAHLLVALAQQEIGEPGTWLAAAVWLHLRDPARSPVDAALHEHAGEDRALLALARAALQQGDVSLDDAEKATLAAIGTQKLELCPASLFVADLAAHGAAKPVWLDLVLERYQRSPGIDVRHDLVTTLQFARSPDRVAQLLADRTTRGAALLFARLTPTEEVLQTLLEMPVPGEEHERSLYAQALAEMGTPAAAPPLAALRDQVDRTGEIAEACARAEAILGRPLA